MKVFDTRQGYVRIGMVVLLVAAAVGAAVFFFTRPNQAQANRSGEEGKQAEEGGSAIHVKSAHPQVDSNFQVTVFRPADVEAYYSANIEAQVPGVAKMLRVAPGSRVKKGQLLVELDVPDLEATVLEKKAIVGQRKEEVKAAVEKRQAAELAIETAKANVDVAKTELQRAQADTLYRKRDYARVDELWHNSSIERAAVDIADRALGVALAAEAKARALNVKADCELADAKANLKIMDADVHLKEQLVTVAASDRKKAETMFEYSRIKAPYDGTIVSRKEDPGSFVQNASTREPTPLLALERTDIVTVVMRVPDNYAPYVTNNTEAVLELDALPGLKIHGRVTRFAPSLKTHDNDRTMRVEMDLWNEKPADFEKFMANAENREKLKEGLPPVVPRILGKNPLNLSTHLLPGMYGKMTLILRTFSNVRLIPSQAIIREAGRAKIWIVQDGKAHKIPVAVQVDDGKLARVERLSKDNSIEGDLKEDTEVIISNQEELFEGMPVKTELEEPGKPQDKKSSH
jgi:HlyD family secretion protein